MFNQKKWHDIANKACDALSFNGLEVIVPFGFELLYDDKYLKGNLRKFYCYIGGMSIDEDIAKDIERDFSEILLGNLKKEHVIELSDLAAVITTRNGVRSFRTQSHIYKNNEKIIDIECRRGEQSILENYAEYVMCSIDAILSSGLREMNEFDENRNSRFRVYQLYIMLEALFGKYMPEMTESEKSLYQQAFYMDNDITPILKNAVKVPAEDIDLEILQSLIFKRLNKVKKIIRHGSGNIKKIQSLSYHDTSRIFSLEISQDCYMGALRFVTESYKNSLTISGS